ncbi:MAG: PD40 domain-containing protein [Chloroflexi bacterium]|nr:PD40 domain-containing protein [Chloroflexota bacterium]
MFTSKRDGRSQIYVMNADGSGQTNLSRSDSNDLWPAWSPNNKQIVFNTSEGVFVMNADGSERKRLAEGSSAAWLPLRGIAFVFPGDKGSVMYVMNSDGSGQSVLWKQEIYNGQSGSPKWNRDGTRAVFGTYRNGNVDVYSLNTDGSDLKRLTFHAGLDLEPAWSPDGKRIAFVSDRDGSGDIFVMNADGTNLIRLTDDPADDHAPIWSADGKKIIFTSNRAGNDEIYVMDADGKNQKNLTNNAADDSYADWQPVP